MQIIPTNCKFFKSLLCSVTADGEPPVGRGSDLKKRKRTRGGNWKRIRRGKRVVGWGHVVEAVRDGVGGACEA